jgi:phosphatidylglycerophosphatase C
MASLAVFDLDGTLTRRDTFLGYLLGYVRRHPARAWRLAVIPYAALAFYFDGRDRGRLKARLLHGILGGASRASIDAWTREFTAAVVADRICPGGRARIEAHRAAGDPLALLSGSPDLYVPEIGRRLGFAQTLCTGVRWNGDVFDGALTTPNRRGEEKVRCIEELRQRHPGFACSAYGNDRADLLHLRRVEHGVLVNGSAAARRAAEKLGIPCEQWC